MAHKKTFALTNTNTTHYSHSGIISPDFSIVEDEEDDMPPQYFFTSEHLTEISDRDEIWSKGLFLLALYNGACNIENYMKEDWWSDARFTRLYDWETSENITPLNTYKAVPQFPFSQDTLQSTKEKIATPYFITKVMYLARKNSDVQSILLLAGNGITWVSLYSLYDTLRTYSTEFNKLISDSGLTAAQIDAFTGTANNFGLLGVNARHGFKNWSTPKNIMSFDDSKKMILKMCKQYVDDNFK